MKHKTIELVIKTDFENEELIKVFNNGTENLKELGIELLEIRVKDSANSLVKGIDYLENKN